MKRSDESSRLFRPRKLIVAVSALTVLSATAFSTPTSFAARTSLAKIDSPGRVGVAQAPVEPSSPPAPFAPELPTLPVQPTENGRIYQAPACWVSQAHRVVITSAMWQHFVANPTNRVDPITHQVAACNPAIGMPRGLDGSRLDPAFPTGSTVTFPAGIYKVANTGSLVIANATDVKFNGTGATIERIGSGTKECGAASIVIVQGSAKVAITGLTIIGANSGAPDNYREGCGPGHGIQVYGADDGTNTDITIGGNTISNTWGDGIYVAGSQRVILFWNTLRDVGRMGIVVTNHVEDMRIHGNIVDRTGLGIGIDAEPNNVAVTSAQPDAGITRIQIDDNDVSGAPEAQIDISAHSLSPDDCLPPIVIRDVTIQGNTTSDDLSIISQGKPASGQASGCTSKQLAAYPTGRTKSGQVRRVSIDNNSSTSTRSGGQIVLTGTVYGSATDNSVASGGLLTFNFYNDEHASCFSNTNRNTGFTHGDLVSDQQLPPSQLSVEQFVTRVALYLSAPPPTSQQVQAYEWQMCKKTNALTAVEVIDQMVDSQA